ncbi:MAG: hypothetical protein AAED33_14590 [Paracoccaceae bacterium]
MATTKGAGHRGGINQWFAMPQGQRTGVRLLQKAIILAQMRRAIQRAAREGYGFYVVH